MNDKDIIEAVTRKLMGTQYVCDNCDFATCNPFDLYPVKHYNERVDSDGPFPDGECPKCGALCYERS